MGVAPRIFLNEIARGLPKEVVRGSRVGTRVQRNASRARLLDLIPMTSALVGARVSAPVVLLRIVGLTGLFVAGAIVSEARAEMGARTRQALREYYRYNDTASAANGAETSVTDEVTVTVGDPETVALPPFEVEALTVPRGLDQAIARAPTLPKKPGKFGTGVIQKDFGKVRMQAVTVLYLPIFVGFSW